MAMLTTNDDRRRKSRNALLSAFMILLVLWTIKLYYPQHTIISAYGAYTVAPEAPAVAQEVQPGEEDNVSAGRKWQSRPSSDISLTDDTFNGTITNKVAVIVETRFRTNLIPLILHFGSVLGPSWPILIYTSAEGVGQFSTSSALGRYLKSGSIQIRTLPQTVLFTNSDSVNAFMTDKWFWEDLAPAENILLFQSDSMLCANAARSVDDFFDYDFVGAPIAEDLGTGYNGGLSLRKRSTTLRVLGEWNWAETGALEEKFGRFEDQWYYNAYVPLNSLTA